MTGLPPTPKTAPAVLPDSANVAEGVVSITKEGATWRPLDFGEPKHFNNPPLAVNNNKGTLWVQFPKFSPDGTEPQRDYSILYTSPLASTNPGQIVVFSLPGVLPASGEVQYIRQISPVAGNHFILATMTTPPGAQNGGLLEYWWIEPATNTVKKLISGPETGGGRFSTTTQNQQWLVWNQYEVTSVDAEINNTKTLLVDLRSGQIQSLQLGSSNALSEAEWRSDGNLLFKLSKNEKLYLLDPATGVQSTVGN